MFPVGILPVYFFRVVHLPSSGDKLVLLSNFEPLAGLFLLDMCFRAVGRILESVCCSLRDAVMIIIAYVGGIFVCGVE